MKIELQHGATTGAEIEVDDELLPDGTVQLGVDSWPACEGPGAVVNINRAEAAQLVAHLVPVFGLEWADLGEPIDDDMPPQHAEKLAELWAAGKALGGDAYAASIALHRELLRLRNLAVGPRCLARLAQLGGRFLGCDLQMRRRGVTWPGHWRARLHTSKNERAVFRLEAFGGAAEEAIEALLDAAAAVEARPVKPPRLRDIELRPSPLAGLEDVRAKVAPAAASLMIKGEHIELVYRPTGQITDDGVEVWAEVGAPELVRLDVVSVSIPEPPPAPDVSNAARDYLQTREWSMGNGQCPECHGVPTSWHGHPAHLMAQSIGHDPSCSLADALRSLGVTPLLRGEYCSPVIFESYVDAAGFLGTRPKGTGQLGGV